MDDAALTDFLEKSVRTSQDVLLAGIVTQQLAKLAPALADEAAREVAIAFATRMTEEGQHPLRKGLASAWLARAGKMVAAGANKAGDVGSAVGAKAAKVIPENAAKAHESGNVAMAIHADGAEGMRRYGGRGATAASMDAAHAAGKQAYSDARAKAYAKFGRSMGRHAFHVGLAAGAAGGAAAGAHAMRGNAPDANGAAHRPLSAKEHEERRNAAKAKWRKRGMATGAEA